MAAKRGVHDVESEAPESGSSRDQAGIFRRIPFHPLLFSVYPILALLAANTGEVLPVDGLRVLLGSLLLGSILVLVSWLVLRRRDSAAMLASLAVLLILSYGRIYDGLKDVGVSGTTIVRHRFLLPAVALLLLVAYFALRRLKPTSTTPYLNIVAISACALPTAVLLVGGAQRFASSQNRSGETGCGLSPQSGHALPDVYLIIMDGYERDDILREMHKYDNSGFLAGLEADGFYVARGSMSNYRHTELSFSSLLNMEYIQSFPGVYSNGRYNQWEIIQRIKDNRVRRELECIGYKTVAVETETFWTEWDDADYFLRRRAGALGEIELLGGASRTEAEFLQTTLARGYLDAVKSTSAGAAQLLDPASESRDLILYQFDELARIPRLPSPKLVFIHVLSPHPPFLFGPRGEPVNIGEFDAGRAAGPTEAVQLKAYADQVAFLNTQLLKAVKAILAASEPEPIIIIQGDHGWADRDHEDKLSILNAYHFPGYGRSVLYPTITPVNSFRLLFDTYFGGNLGRLDDTSFFSSEVDEYNFVEVENSWAGG